MTPEGAAANSEALAACARPHRFVCVQPRTGAGTRAVYRCRSCGGEIGESAFTWYSRGIMDGRKVEQRREANREARREADAA